MGYVSPANITMTAPSGLYIYTETGQLNLYSITEVERERKRERE